MTLSITFLIHCHIPWIYLPGSRFLTENIFTVSTWMNNYLHVKLRNVITHPWASYQIRKIAGCACAGNAGNVFPRRRFQRKPLVSDPDMHHGTCVTHVPWCMSGSHTCGNGENVIGIPGACAPGILRIWQEAHVLTSTAVQHSVHLCIIIGIHCKLYRCQNKSTYDIFARKYIRISQ